MNLYITEAFENDTSSGPESSPPSGLPGDDRLLRILTKIHDKRGIAGCQGESESS